MSYVVVNNKINVEINTTSYTLYDIKPTLGTKINMIKNIKTIKIDIDNIFLYNVKIFDNNLYAHYMGKLLKINLSTYKQIIYDIGSDFVNDFEIDNTIILLSNNEIKLKGYKWKKYTPVKKDVPIVGYKLPFFENNYGYSNITSFARDSRGRLFVTFSGNDLVYVYAVNYNFLFSFEKAQYVIIDNNDNLILFHNKNITISKCLF